MQAHSNNPDSKNDAASLVMHLEKLSLNPTQSVAVSDIGIFSNPEQQNSIAEEKNTTLLNVNILYDSWDPNQKSTVAAKKVNEYKEKMAAGKKIKPLIISQVIYMSDLKPGDEHVYIRVTDGRHRLSAAHTLKIETIEALIPEATIEELKIYFPDILADATKNPCMENKK